MVTVYTLVLHCKKYLKNESCHVIIIFLHGLGRLTFSGIDALPLFPGASTISSSLRFVFEGVLGVWCCPFFQGGWSSSFLMTLLLILSNLVYPVTLHRKRISAASRTVLSPFVVTHVSLHNIYIYIYTHIHIHVYIYIYIYKWENLNSCTVYIYKNLDFLTLNLTHLTHCKQKSYFPKITSFRWSPFHSRHSVSLLLTSPITIWSFSTGICVTSCWIECFNSWTVWGPGAL